MYIYEVLNLGYYGKEQENRSALRPTKTRKIDNKMKKVITILSVFLLAVSYNANAQQKEWQKVIRLLQNEAEYFRGKSGFINPDYSEYEQFTIKEASVSDSLVVLAYRIFDHVNGDPSEYYLRETVVFQHQLPLIDSAVVNDDFSYYFEDFDRMRFLDLTLAGEWIHLVENSYKNTETGQEDQQTTNRILLPIRTQKLKKIQKAIYQYKRKYRKNEN